MNSGTFVHRLVRVWTPDNLRRVAPGALLCAVVAVLASFCDARGLLHIGSVWVPPLLVALAIGMTLHPLSAQPAVTPGLDFAASTLLRIGVALYGARLTVGQFAEGGALLASVAIVAVIGTIAFGAWAARLLGLSRDLGLLTGCATGICGAAAAMAAAAVLPKHQNSHRDLAFTVMGVNLLSTVAMVIYPTLADLLSFSPFEMGAFLGGAIHDVAQVAGAGQTLGPQVLSDAIVTKLLRVACLLPAVTGIAWWVARRGDSPGGARPSPPVFLFGFLALAGLNSLGMIAPSVQSAVTLVSSFLIITAIAALGMKTSLTMLSRIGMAPALLLVAEMIFIGLLVIGLIYVLSSG